MSDPSSAPPSEGDAQALYLFGLDITQNTVGVIWETMFFSAYGIFFAVAVYTIFRKGLKSRASVVMLCVVIYLYASSATLWALNVTDLFKNTHALLIDYPNMPIQDRAAQADIDVLKLGTPEEALFMFNMVVGDSVVIWRAWVLYERTLWVVSIPCFLLLMSFIFNVIDLTCLTGAGFSNQSTVAGGAGVCTHAELISWAFSLVTNVACTMLIGFKAWQHRRSTRALSLVGDPRRISTNKILSILVESGFVYCLFWLTQLILFFNVSRDSPVIYVWMLFSSMGDQISGMYPTLIIVIVNLHQTLWDERSSLTTKGVSVSTVQWSANSKRAAPTDTFVSQRAVDVHLGTNIEPGNSEEINMIPIPSKRPASPDF
ncbi:hypothetical protein DFH07DRAFT_234745 [Mycena maculata]|uniref:Uncharacterized protein n=1 Tax=Mycena maculata TaxID=230809 RepID=A0AAD7MQ08_9AGAR|nr:hypothetical protein DFH07DRAFT_234745 [Mycena maculata]